MISFVLLSVQVYRPAKAPFIAVEPITGLGHEEFPWIEVPPGQYREIRTAIEFV